MIRVFFYIQCLVRLDVQTAKVWKIYKIIKLYRSGNSMAPFSVNSESWLPAKKESWAIVESILYWNQQTIRAKSNPMLDL